MSDAPLFIHISPDWCGQEKLAELFRLNGHKVIHTPDGSNAEAILYAQGSGAELPPEWNAAGLITGLSRHSPHWRPPLEAWRSFTFLARQLPEARFILTTRDLDGWLLDLLIRDESAIARCYAHHRGLTTEELAEHWETGWHAHLSAVEAHFGDDPRLIRIDLENQSPADAAALLSLSQAPADSHWHRPFDEEPESALRRAIDRAAPVTSLDNAYIEDVAAFCLRGIDPQPQVNTGLSGLACIWDGDHLISPAREGSRRMTVVNQPGLGRTAVSAPGRPFKLVRAEGVINDALRADRAMPLQIDMEDSRWLGSPQGGEVNQPVLCHNRREGARNVVLWPLPDQHSIGLHGFDPDAPRDPIPFDQKIDQIVWRGMISGSEHRTTVKPGPASHVLLRHLAEAGKDEAVREVIWDRLCRTSRLSFIRRWFDHPDCDLGVVMAWRFRDFARDPLLSPYCKPRQPPAFFHKFRYQLCLTGYDHGSNFIPMIDSQSVLLKEEDGWEVFYSGRFKPWKHYIPLEKYCGDVLEKLSWARKNPNECKAMSEAARAEVARLREPRTRLAVMARILDGLAAAL
ncbi:hypothetical protein JJJ17_10715 [Paracoccus caeni]|uniref:Glycosyl transferase CAP10 domain-containing protein n=1 Tax=Paracoccus caeni TaxID=657651 RepID=A0A934SJB8_9RHOB|nr:glycosyl transferase family 90 [Paracoccus caeni]MBK4216397.1 hypothetical protein [Paracoccus caeni]